MLNAYDSVLYHCQNIAKENCDLVHLLKVADLFTLKFEDTELGAKFSFTIGNPVLQKKERTGLNVPVFEISFAPQTKENINVRKITCSKGHMLNHLHA